MQKNILISFGKKIKEERLKRELSQEKFAELTDFHRNYIGMIERGERNITLTNIEKFANRLDIKINELMSFNDGK